MSHVENKINWCLKKAERELKEGEKHRGLVEIEPNITKAKEHITKAEHNLKATLYLQKGGYTDWCSSSIFYSIYHCFLAIAAKFGYESRNQECTFALISSLIEENKISLEAKDLEKVSSLEVNESHEASIVINLREEYQYNTKVSLSNNEYEEILNLAKKILDKSKEIIEE